jgi:hypothetical protein
MAARDEEVRLLGIVPKQHVIRYSVNSGRAKYPFKAMIKGDYLVVHTQTEAKAIRDALKSFYRRIKNRRFTVRLKPDDDSTWICRRVI